MGSTINHVLHQAGDTSPKSPAPPFISCSARQIYGACIGVKHTNGVHECFYCGTLTVPATLAAMYSGPQYAGKVVINDQ